jgi:ornithine cyclodeaminase/alanine dehydrogenase-like protein (mu-crystallin family)
VTQTLLLARADVAALLPMDACVAAVEGAFLAHARGATDPPGVLGTHVALGGFHVKTAGLAAADGRPHLFAAKVNANFPGNPARHGLPTIQGVIALFDADRGELLALLDSIEITSRRTAAATAVAAKHLARADAAVATIVGCGEQGRSQLRALCCVRPIRAARAVDADAARAAAYAGEMSRELGVDVTPASDVRAAARECDVCVTCTPSRRPLLDVGDVSPGTFVAAVGADAPEKQEIAPALLAASAVVVDVLAQCAAFGDLHHAIEAGVMRREDVRAELAAIVAGEAAGRRSDDEVVIFDSTGTALQDVAAAALVYERALAAGAGMRVALGG